MAENVVQEVDVEKTSPNIPRNKLMFFIVGIVFLLALVAVGAAFRNADKRQPQGGNVDLPQNDNSKPLQIRSIDPRQKPYSADQAFSALSAQEEISEDKSIEFNEDSQLLDEIDAEFGE